MCEFALFTEFRKLFNRFFSDRCTAPAPLCGLSGAWRIGDLSLRHGYRCAVRCFRLYFLYGSLWVACLAPSSRSLAFSRATSGLFLTPSGVFFIANITTFIPRSLTWEPHAYAHTPLVQVLVSESGVRPCHASSLQSGIVLGQRTSKCVSSSAVGRAVTGDEWVPCTLAPCIAHPPSHLRAFRMELWVHAGHTVVCI